MLYTGLNAASVLYQRLLRHLGPPMSSLKPQSGVKTFELDIHVTFTSPLPGDEAKQTLLALEGFMVELYQPHPQATPSGYLPHQLVPSARLMGPLHHPELVRAGISRLLGSSARTVEVGLRGLLRSSTGQVEWMPWRKNVVLPVHATEQIAFAEGIKYILER